MSDDAESRKAQTGALFSSLALEYDPLGVFAHFGRRLVARVGIEDGQQVLDVASGRGAVLFPAAERVGEAGNAIGIDLAEGMERATNEEATRRGLAVQVRHMDAEHLDFPDAAFDRVVCGFGVMFFPAVSHALSEFRRVLKPGGRLGISTWRAPSAHELDRLLREMGLWKGMVGPVRFDDPDALTALLEQAGFHDVRVVAESTPVVVADIDQYWETARSGGFRASIDALNAAQRDQVRAVLAERLRPYQRPDGLHIEATALLATANR
jgi:ubiquinone/menaquinone biosynthesis C-methylase UbiE